MPRWVAVGLWDVVDRSLSGCRGQAGRHPESPKVFFLMARNSLMTRNRCVEVQKLEPLLEPLLSTGGWAYKDPMRENILFYDDKP
jgi:hypothetical protein